MSEHKPLVYEGDRTKFIEKACIADDGCISVGGWMMNTNSVSVLAERLRDTDYILDRQSHAATASLCREAADTIAALRERVAELEGVVSDVETDLTHALITHFDYDLPAQLVSEIEHAKSKLRKVALAASKRAGDAETAPRSLADGPHDHDHLASGEGE